MQTNGLSNLLQAYRSAPQEFQATSYWRSYERDILNAISSIQIDQLRSGRYPILATFGFGDVVYSYHPRLPRWKKSVLKTFHNVFIKNRPVLPYGLKLSDIREMAYHHCELLGCLYNARPVQDVEMSTFGNPADVFEVSGRKYSVAFLNYYVRYCFAHKYISFQGDETIVELGPGSGYQIEVLKKLYPELTILCFDLPAQIFLCQTYLSAALGQESVVGTEETLQWQDLSQLKDGHVHFFGNWQFPLLNDLAFDLFWNAASFGEMEPKVVENYLSYVGRNADWIYLLQARYGKETQGQARVAKAITFADYDNLLSGYSLQEQHDAYQAHRRLSQSGGYFEAVWRNTSHG
jgi:putative sugar O-methyltransferase